MKNYKQISFILFFLISFCLNAQIHVDQFGYLPNAEKVAVLSDPQIGYNANENYNAPAILQVRDANTNAIIFSGSPTIWNNGATHVKSGDKGWWFDFSVVSNPGSYYVFDETNNVSSPVFDIDENIYEEILKAAGRTYFYNRCNFEKAAPFAESNWIDGNNFNQDTEAKYIFDSTNIALNRDLSGGWFDAGDYNKYVTFAHNPVLDLLAAYEANPNAFSDDWNIPESGNGIPDILDEVKWELDFLIKMNNTDGSTILKIGSRNYSENTSAPPSLNNDPRFYNSTCTSASIAIASMFSKAATVYTNIAGMESFANELETRAIASYNYALPFYNSNALEENCDNGEIISGDADWSSTKQKEVLLVASIYLYELTEDNNYITFFENNYSTVEPLSNNYWAVNNMQLNEALLKYSLLPNINSSVSAAINDNFALWISNNWNNFFGWNESDLYRMEMPDWSYHWGSLLPTADYGNLNKLSVQYNIASDTTSMNKKAAELLHYFHGVNPNGLVYMSNMYAYGAEKSCNEIYHTWFNDGTVYDNALTSLFGPAPGFVVGGPNKDYSVSSFSPPFGQPVQKSYLDFNNGYPDNSWEISEPAIYYQAAYVKLLSNFVDASEQLVDVELINNDIILYPNPTPGLFVIEGDLPSFSIEILNVAGQVVQTVSNAGDQQIIDISALPSGLFLVKIENLQNVSVVLQKIIKE